MYKLFQYILIVIVFLISIYLTYRIIKFGRDMYRLSVVQTLETNKEFREYIKNRFGWR